MNTILRASLEKLPGPKYKALAHALKEEVQDGTLAPGTKLPPVRELAWQLSITPGTVARAYAILTDAGICEATVGRGTFVKSRERVAPMVPQKIRAPRPRETQTMDLDFHSPALSDTGQSALVCELMSEIAQDPPSGVMDYPNRETFRPAREAIMQWLAGTPLGALDERDIVLCHGGQNGILLILQSVLKEPRPVILIEELAYSGFRHAAELLRAEVVPVAMDEHGLVPEALEAAARAHEAQALCTSCEIHNPTGIFTPEERRRGIARVAEHCGFHIIEDDCYRMGRSQAPSYRMLLPERGWYVSSISKTLTPALRVGFAIAPSGQGAKLRRSAEHGFFGLATPLADLTTRLLQDTRTEQILVAVAEENKRYVQSMVNQLGGYDLSWRLDVPIAWLRLPRGWRASAFCQAAAAKGIRLRSAEDFICRDARPPHAVRIAINARLPIERFDAAMATLRDLLDNPPEQIGV
ncbi:MAG: PLP-dependent aminotransferase family protein [Pseudomonadota bacterium]